MTILIAWLLITFLGFSYQLLLTGEARQDRRWFDRLNFSENAKDVANGDVETEGALCIAHFVFFLIGVISYAINPTASRPLSVLGVTMGILFMATPIVLIISSIRRQRRRDRVERRSREQAIKDSSP